MGTQLTTTHAAAASWYGAYVPDLVATAFDACATTGVGPSAEMARRAFGMAVAGLARLAEVEGRDGGEPTTNDLVGCPSIGLHLFLRERYGWAVPDGEALDAIARDHAGERVVEIGSGSGYVAACLRARGVDVVAVAAPEGECRWDRWWPTRFGPAPLRRLASGLRYDARTYLMLMPDARGAGEDMMVEALTRMPVGATLYLYAPEHCAGSRAGRALLDATFREVGRLPMLDTAPDDPDEEKAVGRRALRRMVKARG